MEQALKDLNVWDRYSQWNLQEKAQGAAESGMQKGFLWAHSGGAYSPTPTGMV